MKLLERVDRVCRRRGLSRRTADVYCLWVRHFLRFSAGARGAWTPPQLLGTADVEAFLNHLVGDRHLSASSQNQAMNTSDLTEFGVGSWAFEHVVGSRRVG